MLFCCKVTLHVTIDDQEYYNHEPRRFELIPHSESHCLLHKLLDDDESNTSKNSNSSPKEYYGTLFKEAPPASIEPIAEATYGSQIEISV